MLPLLPLCLAIEHALSLAFFHLLQLKSVVLRVVYSKQNLLHYFVNRSEDSWWILQLRGGSLSQYLHGLGMLLLRIL